MTVAAAILTIAALVGQAPAATRCRPPQDHSPERHSAPRGHRYLCRFSLVGALRVSADGGLGRIDIHEDLAAVLQRDEGIVSMIDISDSLAPKVLGRFDDEAQDSLDGDVAFSDDGRWVFYARQTVQFSRDGIHVLDVSDPSNPTETFYEVGGGAFRIAYYRAGDAEYVIVLDAIDGREISRVVPQSGALVRVFQDAVPALKVGGPASAGIFIDREDAATGGPLMYVTTGRTGLQIYDLTNPEAPDIVGTWDEVGLAEVEVRADKKRRTVYAATEYWFDSSSKPEVIVLDATKLDAIEKTDTWSLRLPADDLWRIQGMALKGRRLLVAHSHAGLVSFNGRGRARAVARVPGRPGEAAGAVGSPYAMDVARRRGHVYVTDASSGALTGLRPLPPRRARPGG